ncbi:N-acetylneuraminate lyase [Lewinella aquimaris]|uniref:N-acetylneuraminate lyase n=1 Tax=Neolewinella aquimaris TaxID=1835722 RepID=A0A840EBK9_9BACT|nr:dihydrodipicolinate synthase family protein [Neolewinella aquimaris]MBB4081082.1 N-acetylneuraminate lyase [Neolewinella aquimaris]
MKDLIAATYAPMHSDGSLNPDIIGTYGDFLRNNGVAGAFVNGSTGDFVSLSTTERKQLIEAWARDRPADFYLVNHVGHTNLREARELASHCADSVDAIGALAPYYFRLRTLDGLLHYCKEIAASAPSTPFYYYHIPVLSGADFAMAEFLKMATREIPTFAGIKYTQVNLADYAACVEFDGGSSNVLFGVDEMLVDSLPLGARGWVGSTYNHLAPLYTELITHYRTGNIDAAAALQKKAVRFVETLDGLSGFNGAGKSFMKELGLDFGPTRFPHRPLTPGNRESALRTLEENGITPYLSKLPAATT